MRAVSNEFRSERSPAEELGELLRPGILAVGGTGRPLESADPRALELLGYADRAGLERDWSELQGALAAAAAFGPGNIRAVLDVPGPQAATRRVAFDWRPMEAGGVLLVSDAGMAESLAADLRHASLWRTVSQITPAVAHDLRAPINAMVFNIEVLKETIAGQVPDTAQRGRLLRYVEVLREELLRLHQGLEVYVAQVSPRSDAEETLDLREPVRELAALLAGPARKQQARIAAQLPEARVPVSGNRFLIRQALLHVAVAALAGVPRDGALEIRLEQRDKRAQVRFTGGDGEGGPGFGLAASPRGTEGRLWTARSVLASLGGAVRVVASTPSSAPSYEIDLDVAQESGFGEKE